MKKSYGKTNISNIIDKKKKMEKILVEYGKIKKIASDCGVSVPTVRYALRGAIDTDLSRMIRNRAVKFFGGVIKK